jgi:hypothetical protein
VAQEQSLVNAAASRRTSQRMEARCMVELRCSTIQYNWIVQAHQRLELTMDPSAVSPSTISW